MSLRHLLTLAVALACVAVFSSPTVYGASIKVTVTGPSQTVFEGPATMTVSASVNATGVSIRRVNFFANSTFIGYATSAPYSVRFANVPAGTYTLKAQAGDSKGNETWSSNFLTVTVTGGGVSAPAPSTSTSSGTTTSGTTVTLTSPLAGLQMVAPANVTLSATATATGTTISRVDFYAGATLVGSDTTSPYAATWSNVPAGSYALTAVATTATGARTSSAASTIYVGTGSTGPLGSGGLVQSSNLVYQGSFRIPANQANGGFEYGGSVIAYNAAHNSLFMTGHDWYQRVGEVAIPAIIPGALSTLATAQQLQPLTDVTEGRLPLINPGDPNAKKIGGLMPYQNKLYVSAYSYYDGASTQVLSHFVSGLDLSATGDVKGPYQLDAIKAGYVSGYMASVPKSWQASLGGPVINGQCCIAIVSRTSYGPAIFSEDPSLLSVVNPMPANPLVYYPSTNPLSAWDSTGSAFNGTTKMGGVVFPENTRSVLYFGRQGTGKFCYGLGTSNKALDGTFDAAGVKYCYDPVDYNKGTHAYPYVYQVWAYDANDLAAARAGTKQPWDVKPYSIWPLSLPFRGATNADGISASYDPASGRIFVSQMLADGSLPVVHVFGVQ